MDSLEFRVTLLIMNTDEKNEEDEMRPEYDLSKLKFVGRGIYAERFRAGVKFSVLNDGDRVKESNSDEEKAGNAEGVQYNSTG